MKFNKNPSRHILWKSEHASQDGLNDYFLKKIFNSIIFIFKWYSSGQMSVNWMSSTYERRVFTNTEKKGPMKKKKKNRKHLIIRNVCTGLLSYVTNFQKVTNSNGMTII